MAGLPLSVSAPPASHPLCSRTLRGAGLSSVPLSRSLLSPYSVAASSRTLRTAAVASPCPAAFCAIRYSSFAVPSATSVRFSRPGALPLEQLRIPRVDLGEELVPPIRHRRREVGPILPLECKQGWRVVEAE